ncbi:2OG-Fe dioxygenase family protein [Streptomyces sp. NPDC012935]|uniref:2OG-Fe dioxygenase family protein n=1 Tax=Streptomyces sp. NPDC012935 TaxID=3364857 RepID=UPI0036AEEF0D
MSVLESELSKNGFAKWNLADVFGISESDSNYQALAGEYDNLPEDPYAAGSGRYRRYARGLYLPWSKEFSWIPATEDQSRDGMNGYYQGNHNPEYVGVVRNLPAISERARNNQLLLDIIDFDFQQTRWNDVDAVWPLHVGVHLIKLSIDEDGGEAVSSPNELHQDGEPFVFAHLMYRRNAEGGDNVIAPPKYRGMQPHQVPDDEVMASFELTRPLEAYGITDKLVSHYVGPIRKSDGEGPGERAILLTDFVPMRQLI